MCRHPHKNQSDPCMGTKQQNQQQVIVVVVVEFMVNLRQFWNIVVIN